MAWTESAQEKAANQSLHAKCEVRERDVRSTEEQMNLRGTIPPRVDDRGSKIEELAGTGQIDSPGG
jgi:hypothetical protein